VPFRVCKPSTENCALHPDTARHLGIDHNVPVRIAEKEGKPWFIANDVAEILA
jgi:hypothetical protein